MRQTAELNAMLETPDDAVCIVIILSFKILPVSQGVFVSNDPE